MNHEARDHSLPDQGRAVAREVRAVADERDGFVLRVLGPSEVSRQEARGHASARKHLPRVRAIQAGAERDLRGVYENKAIYRVAIREVRTK